MIYLKILKDIKAESFQGDIITLRKGSTHLFQPTLDNSGDPEWPEDLFILHSETGELLLIPPYEGNETSILKIKKES